MNARARAARATIRQRTRTQRAASRIRRRNAGSLATYAISAGLDPREARTVASSLRRNAAKLAIVGTPVRVHAGRRMRDAHRYTPAQVAAICMAYKPRKPAYRAARERLLNAVAATRRTTYTAAV